MAQRQTARKESEYEKPMSAAAVIPTLMAVTRPGPSFLVSRSDWRLETMVPEAMIIVMMPAKDTGTSRSECMMGHADPTRESGRPRLMKAT